jgi:uncharacterized membrane protein (DUF485 family)
MNIHLIRYKGNDFEMEELLPHLSAGKIFITQAFLQEFILFGILLGALILQAWSNIFLLLFPILLCAESLFFRAFQVGQEINFSKFTPPTEPLGFTRSAVDRAEFAGILTALILLIQGYDSLARPQLVSTLAPYFLEMLLAAYLLGHYWFFSGLGAGKNDQKATESRSTEALELESSKKMRQLPQHEATLVARKMSSYVGLLSIILFVIGTVFNILASFAFTPAYLISAPGSGLVNGTLIAVSAVYLVILVVPPAWTVLCTWRILSAARPLQNIAV